MEIRSLSNRMVQVWLPENTIEIDKMHLRMVVEHICRSGECRYPLLAIRLLIHTLTGINSDGYVHISARQLAKLLDVNYDTVTKCLKYLRSLDVLQLVAK